MDKYVLRPTQGKRIVQVSVNFHEVNDVKPQPTPIGVTPFSVKPKDINVRLWTHQNPTISQNFIKAYLTKYINEQLIPSFGKFVIDWLKQAKFDFDPSNSELYTTGQAGPMTVTIHTAKLGKVERFVDYLSAETVKSFLSWMQVDGHAFNLMVNNNFNANKWISVIVDGVTYHGLLINNTGIRLGEG